MLTQEKSEQVAFGLFEADLRTGELWRSGHRVRLPRQPFRVLAKLLARPGEIVTREELQLEIWGTNTTVDFDQAIAAAINKIREALGDSAENPRFVETLTKRGYRFIAPVDAISVAASRTLAPPKASTFQEATEPDGGLAEQSVTVAPALSLAPVATPGNDDVSAEAGLLQEGISPGPPPLLAVAEERRPAWPVPAKVALVCLLILSAAAIALAVRLFFVAAASDTAPFRVVQVTHQTPISLGPPNPESFLTIAVEGERVFTSVIANGRPRLSSIDVNTGEVQAIAVPDEISSNSLADVSKDGARILLLSRQSSESEQPLWVIPSAGGTGRRIPGVLAHDAAWMPDGTSILVAAGNDLVEVGPNEDVPVVFAKLPGRAFWLRWSPDGTLLRFTLSNPVTHATSLWEMDARSHVPRPVKLPGLAGMSACCGVWLPDGRAYVFQAGDNLWQLGSGLHPRLAQLTNGPLRSLSPASAKSGTRIFFLGLEPPSGLQRFDAAAKEFRPASAFLAEANRIDYSRDGKWVAWTDLHQKLWRAHADGTDRIRLTSDALEVFLAQWAPDGKRLAMMARKPGGVWQILIVDANGGKAETLVSETRNAADPGWSPDGKRVVFGREPDLMGKESGPHTLKIITLSTHATEDIPASDNLFSPRWSPDGRWIMALTLDQGTVMLYDVTHRQWRKLLSTSAADPVWSSDSKAIYLHAFSADRQPILKVDVSTGHLQIVADLSNFPYGEVANYFFGGVTPAGYPLVQPRVGTGNLYALELPKR